MIELIETGRVRTGARDAWTYFWPFGVEFDGSGRVLQGPGKVSEFDEGGRPVGEEDVIARVERDGLAVEADGRLEIPVLTGLVRLAHLVQEAGFTGGRQLRVGIHLHLSIPITNVKKKMRKNEKSSTITLQWLEKYVIASRWEKKKISLPI